MTSNIAYFSSISKSFSVSPTSLSLSLTIYKSMRPIQVIGWINNNLDGPLVYYCKFEIDTIQRLVSYDLNSNGKIKSWCNGIPERLWMWIVYFKSKTIHFMFSFTFSHCLDLSVIIICFYCMDILIIFSFSNYSSGTSSSWIFVSSHCGGRHVCALVHIILLFDVF